MKRILTVLVLLVVACGMAFSVTGKVFTRLNAGGVSLGDSGVDVNFDMLTFEYKYAGTLNNTGLDTLGKVSGAAAGATVATTPGYFKIFNVKLGDALTIGSDFQLYTLGTTAGYGASNNSTQPDSNVTYGYNKVTIQPVLTYQVNDSTKITMDWSDGGNTSGTYSEAIIFGGGSSSLATSAFTTNAATDSVFQFGIPAKINTKVGNIGIEAYPYFVTSSEAFAFNGLVSGAGTTNASNVTATAFGTYVSASVPLNDSFTVNAKVSIDSLSQTFNYTSASATNVQTVSAMPFGIFGELSWALSSQAKMNFGAGYKIPLNNVVVTKTLGYTNTTTTTVLGLQGYDPLFAIGGSTKFAQNWTFGINAQMAFAPAQSASKSETLLASTNNTTSSSLLAFNNTPGNEFNWDSTDGGKSIWLSYTADAFTFRFSLNSAGAGIISSSCVDISYTY